MCGRVHAYLATICDLGAELVHVGGVADHVHLVTTLPRTLSQAQSVEQIKKASSKWIKELDERFRGFFRQRGYGAFSVSPSQLKAVLKYIKEQLKRAFSAGAFCVTFVPGALPQANGECCAFGAK